MTPALPQSRRPVHTLGVPGIVSGMRFTVEEPQLIIRRTPDLDADTLVYLEEGDVITAADVFIEEGLEWVRLCKGASAIRLKGGRHRISLDLREDGFVPTQHPTLGSFLKKHAGVMVQEVKEDGVLSKAEILDILAKSSDPDIPLPLESKFWSKHEFELYVMSGGIIRPANCSMPDERLMENINMSKEEVMRALSQAADWIAGADAIIIGSGAGMGVESGLGTFRGATKGVWSGLDDVGLAYEDICQPKWFQDEPHLAWGFWNFCHETYQATVPHSGYTKVHEWVQKCPLGFFSFTSNIDSHWSTAGFDKDRILEVHGAVQWLQCSKPCCVDVWKAPVDLGLVEDPETHRVKGVLPTCPKCKAIARPDVQMFGGDTGFSKARRSVQLNRYEQWLKTLESRPDKESLRITCLEIGCGLTVPTVRKELEGVMRRFPSARLIRVNPENPGLARELCDRGVSLPLCGGDAISELQKQVSEERHLATFVLWDEHGGGAEIRAPHGTNLGKLLRMLEAQGSPAEVRKDTTASVSSHFSGLVETLTLDSQVGLRGFFEVKRGSRMELTAILGLKGAKFASKRYNALLEERVAKVSNLLDDVNELFGKSEYQQKVRECQDRRSVVKMCRAVQFQVLPKYGIEATEKGAVVMATFTSTAGAAAGMQEKIQRSMKLSYIASMDHLPQQLGKASKAAAVELPSTPSSSSSAPAPSYQRAAEPLEVTLMLIITEDDGKPEKCPPLSVTVLTTVGELRAQCQEAFKWDDKTLSGMKFLRGTSRSGCLELRELNESAFVEKVLYVRGAPSLRTPELVEVSFVQMAPDDDKKAQTFLLAVMTDDDISAVRVKLGEAVGKSEADLKRCKFLMRLNAMSFGALKDHEKVGDRRVIFVHGLFPLGKVLPNAPSASSTSTPSQSSTSSKAHTAPTPQDTFKELQRQRLSQPSDASKPRAGHASPTSNGQTPSKSSKVGEARGTKSSQKESGVEKLMSAAATAAHPKNYPESVEEAAICKALYEIIQTSHQTKDAWNVVPEEERESIFWRIVRAPVMRRLGMKSFSDRRAVEQDPDLAPILAKYGFGFFSSFIPPSRVPAVPVPAGPCKVELVKMGTHEDDSPESFTLECPSPGRVRELRRCVAEARGLSASEAKKMKFLFKQAMGFVTGLETERCVGKMFLHGLDTWPGRSS